jgi:hypothetical protein
MSVDIRRFPGHGDTVSREAVVAVPGMKAGVVHEPDGNH